MTDVPFAAFGNEELEAAPPIKEGDLVKCPHCARMHVIECGTDQQGKKTNLLMFYQCGKKTYLAGVDGRNVMCKLPRGGKRG